LQRKLHYEAVANIWKLLENRRKDLAMIKQHLNEISVKLVNEDLEEMEEEKMIREIRDKKAAKKNHKKEVKLRPKLPSGSLTEQSLVC